MATYEVTISAKVIVDAESRKAAERQTEAALRYLAVECVEDIEEVMDLFVDVAKSRSADAASNRKLR